MPGDVQRPLSKEEQLGAAVGTCSVIRQDLEGVRAALGLLGVMAHCENARKTMDAAFEIGKVVEHDLEYLAHLEQEIGPFLSTKEVLSKNEQAGVNV